MPAYQGPGGCAASPYCDASRTEGGGARYREDPSSRLPSAGPTEAGHRHQYARQRSQLNPLERDGRRARRRALSHARPASWIRRRSYGGRPPRAAPAFDRIAEQHDRRRRLSSRLGNTRVRRICGRTAGRLIGIGRPAGCSAAARRARARCVVLTGKLVGPRHVPSRQIGGRPPDALCARRGCGAGTPRRSSRLCQAAPRRKTTG
jgi:hypothetical protein